MKVLSSGTIERLHLFKLLGIHIQSSVGWSMHIENVV